MVAAEVGVAAGAGADAAAVVADDDRSGGGGSNSSAKLHRDSHQRLAHINTAVPVCLPACLEEEQFSRTQSNAPANLCAQLGTTTNYSAAAIIIGRERRRTLPQANSLHCCRRL